MLVQRILSETSLNHSNRIMDTPINYEDTWVKKFDTRRKILTGKTYLRAKRIFDLTVVISTIPFWLPVFVFIVLLIKISSPGAPAIFTQLRTGRGGRRFRMYKFRSMVPNAEELKKKYMYLNELQWPDFKISNDPRITPIGRILRKTSLDELPQLINILRGEMSLVGPRPTSFSAETYQLWQTERLDVIPGLTGLWQIMGRAKLEFDDRLRLDIIYIEKASLLFDIEILVRTVLAVFKQQGAL